MTSVYILDYTYYELLLCIFLSDDHDLELTFSSQSNEEPKGSSHSAELSSHSQHMVDC